MNHRDPPCGPCMHSPAAECSCDAACTLSIQTQPACIGVQQIWLSSSNMGPRDPNLVTLLERLGVVNGDLACVIDRKLSDKAGKRCDVAVLQLHRTDMTGGLAGLLIAVSCRNC